MLHKTFVLISFLIFSISGFAQTIEDDFEGNGNISTWAGDDCNINTSFANPYSTGINTSNTVLQYRDVGGTYANVRFDASRNFVTSANASFLVKVYVPSSGITGAQTNQVSLKLQNGNLNEAWSTQCEIIKTITLDEWQLLTFDFAKDSYVNLNENSLPPTQRSDFNRVVIQVNGENNADNVIAYLDDFYYENAEEEDSEYNQLVWSDEFDEDGPIDDTKWFHQTKLPNGSSWYNGEIQHYTDEDSNSYVQDGVLHLTARKESYTNENVTKEYTSARLNSKFAFTYGRVEVRAKLPTGVGTWPAIWTLGKNIQEPGAYWEEEGFGTTPWPACGEIDIMEHWGNNQNYVSSATHTPSSFGGTVNVGGRVISTASTAFHVYALEWSEDKLIFTVDDVEHFTYNPQDKNADTWPFTADQYILLNFAIQPNIASSFTKGSMDIDYVRVYEKNSASIQKTVQTSTPLFYPNPVSSNLTIALSEESTEAVELHIYDFTGKITLNTTVLPSENKIELTELDYLAKGMYALSYIHNGKTYHFKFVKN